MAAKEKISAEVVANLTTVDRQKEGALLRIPLPAKTPQSLEQENKPEKKPEDDQSSVARHLVQNDACSLAYNACSFRVVCVCLSKSHVDVMEALRQAWTDHTFFFSGRFFRFEHT